MPLALANGKEVKYSHNTMRNERLAISLTKMLLLSGKFSDMLSNRNWTYVEVTNI
jgi:hypothetical protein